MLAHDDMQDAVLGLTARVASPRRAAGHEAVGTSTAAGTSERRATPPMSIQEHGRAHSWRPPWRRVAGATSADRRCPRGRAQGSNTSATRATHRCHAPACSTAAATAPLSRARGSSGDRAPRWPGAPSPIREPTRAATRPPPSSSSNLKVDKRTAQRNLRVARYATPADETSTARQSRRCARLPRGQIRQARHPAGCLRAAESPSWTARTASSSFAQLSAPAIAATRALARQVPGSENNARRAGDACSRSTLRSRASSYTSATGSRPSRTCRSRRSHCSAGRWRRRSCRR